MILPPLPEPGGVRYGGRLIRAGFTLLEMMLVVIIIGMIAGTVVPIVTRPESVEQRSDTIKEMYSIVDAVMGRPDLGDYGYVGAMGRLPHPAGSTTDMGVNDLYVPPASDPVNLPAMGGLSSGWIGPFLRSYQPDPTKDAWGRDYQFAPSPLDGTGHWRIVSEGPDGQLGTVDDLGLPDNTSTDYFATIGTLTVDLFLSRETIVTPLPDAWLVGNVSGIVTPVIPTIYLPSSVDGTSLACAGPTPAANCPGSCNIQDSTGRALAFGSGSAASYVPPYHVGCTGIPFGLHHLQIPIQDPAASAALTTPLDVNVLVEEPNASARFVIGDQSLPQSQAAGQTIGFAAPTVPVTATIGTPTTVLTGGSGTFPVADLPTTLDFRISGTVEVAAANVTCNFALSIPGVVAPTIAVTSFSTTTPTAAAPADQPFAYDFVYTVPATGTFNLSSVTFRLTPATSNCTVTSIAGEIMRSYEPSP